LFYPNCWISQTLLLLPKPLLLDHLYDQHFRGILFETEDLSNTLTILELQNISLSHVASPIRTARALVVWNSAQSRCLGFCGQERFTIFRFNPSITISREILQPHAPRNPPEIRLKILKHLLVIHKDRTVEVESGFVDMDEVRRRNEEITRSWSQTEFLTHSIPSFKPKRIQCKPSFYPNILRVCQQLYTEGKHVFHQHNRFITVSGPLNTMVNFKRCLMRLGNFKAWNARVPRKNQGPNGLRNFYFAQGWSFAFWDQGQFSPRVRLAAKPSGNEQPLGVRGEILPCMEVHLDVQAKNDTTVLLMGANLPYICEALHRTLPHFLGFSYPCSLELKFRSDLANNKLGQLFNAEMIESARVDEVNVWHAYIPFLRALCAYVDNISFGQGTVDPEMSYLGHLVGDWTNRMKFQRWPEAFRSNLTQVKSLFDQAEQLIVEGRCDQARTELEFLLKMLYVIFEAEARHYRSTPPTWTLRQTIFQTYLRIAMLPTRLEVKKWNYDAPPTENELVDAEQTQQLLLAGRENLTLAHVSPALDWPARIALRLAQLAYAMDDDQSVFQWLIEALSHVVVGEMIALMDPLSVSWASVQVQAKQILLADLTCVKRLWRMKKYNHRRVRKRQFQLVESVIQARYGPLMRCYLPSDWLENVCQRPSQE
jgi:hypothetical protein